MWHPPEKGWSVSSSRYSFILMCCIFLSCLYINLIANRVWVIRPSFLSVNPSSGELNAQLVVILNAFGPRVDKVWYKILYLEKESRHKYTNFGEQLLFMEFWNDNAKNTKYSLRCDFSMVNFEDIFSTQIQTLLT